MGNSKSKKMKINQSDTGTEAGTRERINSIKTDISEATTAVIDHDKRQEINSDKEAEKPKDNDNASSASTVEALDDNNNTAAARSKTGKMPSAPIKLYYLPPSPPCRSVMMTAKALGLDLDLNMTNILEGAHMTPEFLKMNPQHTIPTMDDSGFILWESRAIQAYLVNAYGKDDSLYPKNPRLRAIVDQRLNFDLGTLYLRYITLYSPIIFRGEAYSEENGAKLKEALGWLNTMIEGKAFVAGDNLTIADISIIVTFTNLEALAFDFSAFENIKKWFENTKNALEPYGYKEIDYAGGQMLANMANKQKQ